MIRAGTAKEPGQFPPGFVDGHGRLQGAVVGAPGGISHMDHGHTYRADHRFRLWHGCFNMI